MYSGRRRAQTRTSGFKVHSDTTGGEYRIHSEKQIALQKGEVVAVTFLISGHEAGDLVGYGTWFWYTPGIKPSLQGGPKKRTLTEFGDQSWNKLGSMWVAEDASPQEITLKLVAKDPGNIALYAPMCGRVRHKHLDSAPPRLMRNMYQYAPEALFISEDDAGQVTIEAAAVASDIDREIILKSCNRCGRYLPANVPLERNQLSFNNHCVAAHSLPCKHTTFGRLRNIEDSSKRIHLEHGYQLECRFCKKFEVNAAHNPQRTPAQMKEDAARRRAFELLLAELYGGTPQLRYRHQNGTELADDVWKRFGAACFNCGARLATPREMHLDHTRPLALLWPLDGTATALCGPCNSGKSDRAPADFYPPAKLAALSRITGIPPAELDKTSPNTEALDLLLQRREWFFNEFLLREEMKKERDGKVAGELVVKALQKVLARSQKHKGVSLRDEYERLRAKKA